MKLTIHNENIYVYLESITPKFRAMLLNDITKCENYDQIMHSFEGREMVHISFLEAYVREYVPKAIKPFWDFVNAFKHHNGIYNEKLKDALLNQITIKTKFYDFDVDMSSAQFVQKIMDLNFEQIDSTRYFLKVNEVLQIEVDVYLKELSVFNYKAFFGEEEGIDDFEFCSIAKHTTINGLLQKIEGFIKIIQLCKKL